MKQGSAKNKGSRITKRASNKKVMIDNDALSDFDSPRIEIPMGKLRQRKMIPLEQRVTLYSRALGGMINYDGSQTTTNKHFYWVGDEGQAHKMINKPPDLQLTIRKYVVPGQAISRNP
jgi:hypothetical protein